MVAKPNKESLLKSQQKMLWALRDSNGANGSGWQTIVSIYQ